jgi:hypothetical protein
MQLLILLLENIDIQLVISCHFLSKCRFHCLGLLERCSTLPNFTKLPQDLFYWIQYKTLFIFYLNCLLLLSIQQSSKMLLLLLYSSLTQRFISILLRLEKFDPFINIGLHGVNKYYCLVITVHYLCTACWVLGSREIFWFLKNK